jgi:putative DNA primase/helicase
MTIPLCHTERKTFLSPRFENFPAELTSRDQWVLWKLTPKGKVPFQVNGRPAKSNDAATWASFKAVKKAFESGGYEGLGFVLTVENGVVGLDLDHCVDFIGNIETWAKKIIDHLKSYTELSPGGAGIRIFVKGSLPVAGKRKDKFEVYQSGRFLTVTGNSI